MEVSNVLYCCQRRTEPWPQVTYAENSVKYGHVVFTAQCYASVVYAVIMCPSLYLCPFIRLSQVSVIQRWVNLGSQKQHRMIAQGV